MSKAQQVVENIAVYNSIPMRGQFSFIYENNKHASKGLIKLTQIHAMKVSELKNGKSGAFAFQTFIVKKDQSVYLYKGEQVTCQEWHAKAGIEASNEEKEASPLLHFRIDRVQGLKAL